MKGAKVKITNFVFIILSMKINYPYRFYDVFHIVVLNIYHDVTVELPFMFKYISSKNKFCTIVL
jgi:hypothetical protein